MITPDITDFNPQRPLWPPKREGAYPGQNSSGCAAGHWRAFPRGTNPRYGCSPRAFFWSLSGRPLARGHPLSHPAISASVSISLKSEVVSDALPPLHLFRYIL